MIPYIILFVFVSLIVCTLSLRVMEWKFPDSQMTKKLNFMCKVLGVLVIAVFVGCIVYLWGVATPRYG